MIRRFAAAAAPFALLLAASAAAEDAPPIGIELNKLEPADGACRAYLVVDNRGGALESLELDLVVFDRDGVILRRLAVEAGPLRAGRETVKAFDMTGLDCGAVGRALLNDVLVCRGPGAEGDCLSRIEARSRAGAPFTN